MMNLADFASFYAKCVTNKQCKLQLYLPLFKSAYNNLNLYGEKSHLRSQSPETHVSMKLAFLTFMLNLYPICVRIIHKLYEYADDI